MTVLNLDDYREDPPEFLVLAMCLSCMNRWTGTVPPSCSLFGLECPNCHEHDSFASFVPSEYVAALPETEEEGETPLATVTELRPKS